MADSTAIAWTDDDNPWWGCSTVSPGCDHCYAEAMDRRTGGNHRGPHAIPRLTSVDNRRKPRRWQKDAEQPGKRRQVFCASMCDVFDKNAPEGARDRLWALIRETPMLGLAAAYQTRSEHREIPSRRLGQWLSECLARGHS